MNISRVTTFSLALAVAVFALGYANPAFAPKPVCEPPQTPPHPSCKDDDSGKGEDGDVFKMVISGDIGGGSNVDFPWSRSGGKTSIGGPPHGPDHEDRSGELTDLGPFFTTLSDGMPFSAAEATACFGVGTHDIAFTFDIRGGGLGTGKKDVAQAQFWFDAKTFKGLPADEDILITLTYQLRYLGTFMEPNWLPAATQTSVLNMTEWRLTATNEGEAIKAISCIGEGIADVRIDVTNVTVTPP